MLTILARRERYNLISTSAFLKLPDIVQYGNIPKDCSSSLLPRTELTYLTNAAGNEPFQSRGGWLVRCEATKV